MATTVMLDQLNAMYDSGDENVRLLYKYRPCQPHHVDCLRNDTLWFAAPPQLNDPFDCVIRLPRSIDAPDIQDVRAHLSEAQPYRLDLSDPGEIAEYIGQSHDLPPLVPLGLMAAQLHHERLLEHIRDLIPNDDAWVHELIIMAREVAERLLNEISVFCVSEPNNHQLMWAHYAAGHTGFCTGYVCPVGILNPAMVHKVNYVETPRNITAWQLVDDPGSVHRDLTLTKPSQWSYEAEWRVTLGNMAGLLDNLLPYREVILGARISPENEESVRRAIGNRDVRIARGVLKHDPERFEIRIEPA